MSFFYLQNVLHSRAFIDLPLTTRAEIMADINELIHSGTEENFNDRLVKCKCIWEKECTEFWRYFERNILGDLRTSSRYNAEPYGVFYPVGGVSNNARYRINFVLAWEDNTIKLELIMPEMSFLVRPSIAFSSP